MENKINIAELLKDCPQGMELDCTMFENPVKYMGLTNSGTYIKIKTSYDKVFYLTKEGYMFNMADSKCVIFPKGKATWEGFVPPCQFKDGDIVANQNNIGTWIGVYYKHDCLNETFSSYCYIRRDGIFCTNSDTGHGYYKTRLATEEEKQKLFDAIKANGYKWNPETKVLEKLVKPIFKAGDRIAEKNGITKPFTISQVGDCYYSANEQNAVRIMSIKDQDNYELVPDKFDISTLKPFDYVLVRLTTNCIWMPKFFSHYDTNPKIKHYPFVTTDNIGYPQCIPYNGNEHLCRKADKCDEYYKNW